MDLFSLLIGQVLSGSGGGGGGGSQKKIVDAQLLNDGSLEVEYEDGTFSTITPTYDDNRIVSVDIDGKTVTLTYDNEGNLITVGNADIDVSEYIGVGIVPSGTFDITSNGTYNIGQYESVDVNIASPQGIAKVKEMQVNIDYTIEQKQGE